MVRNDPLPDARPGGEGNGSQPSVEQFVGEYIDRLNRGEKISARKILEDHPDVAGDIIEHLEAFMDFGSDADLEPAASLGTLGDYTLRRQIGRGGMGVVYDAWQNSMDRRVALKVLPAGVAADDRAFHRFMREAKTAGKLHHQNVVGVYAMGIDNNTPYYAMEFVEGNTLGEILARLRASNGTEEDERTELQNVSQLFGKPGREGAAFEIEAAEKEGGSTEEKTAFGSGDFDIGYYGNLASAFADVAEGLQHAHSCGVVHRDIKPSNLILDQEGRLRILDFGLARFEGQQSLTLSGDLMGTVLYMSPEQAMAKRVPLDHRTDIYSLGATMYEMLTWRVPFKGKDYQDTLSQIIVRDARPLRALNPKVPRDLETIVLKCLRKDPGDRYGTSEALAQDLRRFAREEPIEARPMSTWERSIRNARRHRGRIALGLVAAALFIFAGLWVMDQYSKWLAEENRLYDELVLESFGDLGIGKYAGNLRGGAVSDLQKRTLFQELDVEGRLKQSIERLASPINPFPGRPEARYLTARAWHLLGDQERSFDIVSSVLESDPEFAPAWILGRRILERRGAKGELDRYLDRAARAGPEWLTEWLRGESQLAEGEWPEAIAEFTKLLRDLKDSPDPYSTVRFELLMARAIANLELKRYFEAERDLLETRFLRPESLLPPLLLGKLYVDEGEIEVADRWFDECFEEFEETERRDDAAALFAEAFASTKFSNAEKVVKWAKRRSPSLKSKYQRMFWLSRAGLPDAALSLGRKLLEENPDDLTTAVLLADASRQRGEMDEAWEYAARYWQSPPADFDSFFVGSMVSEWLGCKPESEILSRRALAVNPQGFHVKANIGAALVSQGRFASAIKWLEHMIEKNPMEAGAHSQLAWAHQHLGNHTEAVRLAQRGVENRPSAPEPLCTLGWILQLQGFQEEAESSFREAIERSDPRGFGREVRYWLGKLQEERGELEKAWHSYAEALDGPTPWLSFDQVTRKLLDRFALQREGKLLTPLTLQGLQSWLREHENLGAGCFQTLALVSLISGESRDPDGALRYARRAAELAPFSRSANEVLACVEFELGNEVAAVQAMERLTRPGRAEPRDVARLAEYRSELDPDLASFASLDAVYDEAAGVVPGFLVTSDEEWVRFFRDASSAPREGSESGDAESVPERIAAFLALERNARRSTIAEYFRGRRLEESGDFNGALEAFDLARQPAEPGPEALLRSSACLVAVGDDREAEALLYDALSSCRTRDMVLWKVWAALHLARLGTSTPALIDRFPPCEKGPRGGFPAELHTVLGAIRDDGLLRVNCGASFDEKDPGGRRWSRDVFFDRESSGVTTTTADPDEQPLDSPWWCERRFDAESGGSYHLSLPAGRYAVTLWFVVGASEKEKARSFDVHIEESEVARDFTPMLETAGGRVIELPIDRVEVTDGSLDVRFAPEVGRPAVSAIEIRPFD